MNKSSSLLDLFIIYAIEILCNIEVDIIVNININRKAHNSLTWGVWFS